MPPLPAEIAQKVRQILEETFEVEPSAIAPGARLKEELGLDSLDGVDLVVALEKAFRCRISEEDARGIRTFQDICDRVASRLPTAAPQG